MDPRPAPVPAIRRGPRPVPTRMIAGLVVVLLVGLSVAGWQVGSSHLPAAPGGSGAAVPASVVPSAGAEPPASPAIEPSPSATPTGLGDPPIGSALSQMSGHLTGDVYGYLPYWEMDKDIEPYLDWNALSTIALFSVGARTNGTLVTTAPGYTAITSALGRRIIATARSRGVRPEIVFTSFGLTKNTAFFTTQAAQAQTIAALRSLVAAVGARGVNVDVELLAGAQFPAYADFCRRLLAALRLDDPTATVTVATNANTSGARMAKAAIAAGADRAFMMGYAYRSSGSAPGGIAPLDYRGSLTKLDLRASLALYTAAGVPMHRVILGLPLYGMSWPTVGPGLGDPQTGAGSSYIPRRHLADLAANAASIALDPVEPVEWFARQDPATLAWNQVFFDSPRSLAPKFQLAIDAGLAGIGFWALGYDRGLPGYWDLVTSMFGPPKVLAVSVPARTRELVVPVAVAAVAGSRPLAGLQLSSDGARWSPTLALPSLPPGSPETALRPGLTWTMASGADGVRRLWVRGVDTSGFAGPARIAKVTLDRTGPLLRSAPTVRWNAAHHAWRVTWSAAIDGAGIAGYKVRARVGSGGWRIVAASTTARSLFLRRIPRTATLRVAIAAVDRLGNWGAARVGRGIR